MKSSRIITDMLNDSLDDILAREEPDQEDMGHDARECALKHLLDIPKARLV